MSKTSNRIISIIVMVIIIISTYSAINYTYLKMENDNNVLIFHSYLDIPQITAKEIEQIEEFQQRHQSLILGVPISTESFLNNNTGNLEGFTPLLCNWLTDLFGIEFKIVNYEFAELITALNCGDVDFAYGLAPTEERKNIYIQTDSTIIDRYFVYYKLLNSKPLSDIEKPKIGFLEGSATTNAAMSLIEFDYEPVIVQYLDEGKDLLLQREIDAFCHQDTSDIVFFEHYNIVSEDFYPITFISVVLTARKEFEPIISVVQKALDNGARPYITELYHEGNNDYLRYKLNNQLTEEEKEYIKNTQYVNFVAAYYNYPISFYNKYDREWHGISFDIIDEFEIITGLSFNLINNNKAEWLDIKGKLENGEASMIDSLIKTTEREGQFIWTDTPLVNDNYVFISKSQTPMLNMDNIDNIKIGITKDTAYISMFKRLFPNQTNYIEYDSFNDTFNALKKNEVNLIMSSTYRLMALTNYYEFYGYKINYEFDEHEHITFGFNINEDILCSILNKAIKLIDVEGITKQWMTRTYDYEKKLIDTTRPYIIGLFVLISSILGLIVVMLIRKHNENKKLWEIQDSILTILATLIEQRDGNTGLHITRVQKYLKALIDGCLIHNVYVGEIKAWQLSILISSSKLHDVGKISISDLILNKPGHLTDDEFQIMKKHTLIGGSIIDQMSAVLDKHEFFKYAKDFAEFHHERIDGDGYPHGLVGDKIPLIARMMSLVDVYDAITSERIYKKALSHEEAVDIILKGKSTQFDSKLVSIFEKIKDKFDKIREENN